MPFTSEELESIAAAREPRIETRSGTRLYRTVIWAVVEEDEVYVRSVRGSSGRWYQRVLDDPEVALLIGDTRIAARAIPATDPRSVQRASDGLRKKYRPGSSLDSMLHPDVLGTTLRLEPRV